MAAVQLSFTLRTSGNVKTVHLLGSWDNYNGQLPLSKDPTKSGGWKGIFRFPSTTLRQGQRYWYFYIMDGYHVSHDPAKSYTTEPTTGRNLNILDVPAASARPPNRVPAQPKRAIKHGSVDIPTGRGLSPSRIQSPVPVKPNQTRRLTEASYSPGPTMAELTSRFVKTGFDDDYSLSSSPPSSVGSSLSSRSSRSERSSPSSISSYSSDGVRAQTCKCERYGITRKGERVKLDCGGTRCGYVDESCSSESDEEGYVQRSSRERWTSTND